LTSLPPELFLKIQPIPHHENGSYPLSLHPTLSTPTPPLTEANLRSQNGKVFIVTGGNAGIGFELVKILYSAGAKVYIAARSRSKAEAAIKSIHEMDMKSPGEVKLLELNLGDLESVKKAAETFKRQESKLDVLWNNAGISHVPVGSKSKQGYERTSAQG
jgi:NAD(P)-dependent dehydrogenase (short-subunit alcohol dehydrogenase family)